MQAYLPPCRAPEKHPSAALPSPLVAQPVKSRSSVLLPWREEEVEEGGLFPLTSILSHGGERKIEVKGCYRPRSSGHRAPCIQVLLSGPFLKSLNHLSGQQKIKCPRFTLENGGTQVRAYSPPSVETRNDHRWLPCPALTCRDTGCPDTPFQTRRFYSIVRSCSPSKPCPQKECYAKELISQEKLILEIISVF